MQNTVNGLATAAELSSLSSAVDGLATSSDLTTGLANLQTQVDALATSLANVANQDDIAAITSQLNSVQEDLDELLAANAVINQNITINNVATLEYAESIISTATDDPNVIVNGMITVSVDESDFNSSQLTRVNEVVSKFATALSSVTITNTYSPTMSLNFANLAFVDAGLTINGSTNLVDGETGNDVIRTITGDLTITNVTGDVNLGSLTRANNISIPTGLTAIMLGSVEAQSISTTGSATGELQLHSATVINAGNSIVNNLYAPKATDVDFKMSAAASNTIVNAPVAATIDITGNSAAGNSVTLTGTSTTIAHIDALSAISTITSNKVAELHVGALANATHIDADAVVANLAALASVSNGIEMQGITNFNAPVLDVSGVVSITAATAATVKDISTGYSFGAPNVTTLTISALADTNAFATTGSGNDFGKLTDLTVTGVADSAPSIGTQTNVVSSTSAVLVNANVAGTIDRVLLYTGTKLGSVQTAGYIRWFELRNGGSDLSAATIGHDHIEGSDAATFIISNNSALTGLTPSALNEVGNITIEDNPKLATLNFASFSTLPQLGSYTITVSNTALTGNYVEATLLVTTTAARVERIRSAALNSFKPAMTLAAASAAVDYSFAGDIISSVTTSTRSNVNDDIVATSTNTSTFQSLIQVGSPVVNSSTKVTSTLEEEDFVYVENL